MSDSIVSRLNAFHERNRSWLPAAFFVAGFSFDVLMVNRVDDPITIVQQLVYLTLLSLYTVLEFREAKSPLSVHVKFQKLWSFRNEAAHFLFGTLLNVYALFYFKSASLISAAAFMAIVVVVLIAKEFEAVKSRGPAVRIGLLSFCLTSFFASLTPIAFGFIGIVPFAAAVGLALIWIWALRTLVHKFLGEPVDSRHWAAGVTIQAALLILYFFHAIPPVPLSAKFVGIYHEIRQHDDKYELLYDRPFWKIWQRGDQTFRARPGDKIYAFASVFSPNRVKDEIRIRWSFHDPRTGWQPADSIPILIKGGRDEGFRGFAYKQNYQEGDWRVSLETSDGREFARLGFTIVNDTTQDRRTYFVDVK
jgi:hypothetical protein